MQVFLWRHGTDEDEDEEWVLRTAALLFNAVTTTVPRSCSLLMCGLGFGGTDRRG